MKKYFKKTILIFFIVIIGFVLTEFVVRGPIRAVSNSNDLTAPYWQARAWLKGINPYQRGIADIIIEKTEKQNFNSGVYPPTTSFIFSFMSLLSWSMFKIIFLFISLILFILMILYVADQFDESINKKYIFLFIIFIVAFAPFHSGFGIGQVSMPVISLCVISYCLYKKNNFLFSGLLLSIALCLKPQISIFFLVFYILRGQLSIPVYALMILIVIAIISEIPYLLNGYEFGQSWIWWKNSIIHGYGSTGGDRFQFFDVKRFSAINLHVLLLSFFKTKRIVNFLVIIFFILMFSIYLYYNFCLYEKKYDLLLLSVLSILMLFPVYHRFYDAGVIIIPLAWALSEYFSSLQIPSKIVIGLSCIFLIPGSTILIVLNNNGFISDELSKSLIWNIIIMPHQIWALILIYSSLIYAARIQNIRLKKNASLIK